jgi:HlyD family secretion protein
VVKAPIGGVVTFDASGGSSSSSASSLLSQLPSSLQSTASSVLGGATGGNAPSSSGVLTKDQPVSSGQGLLTITDVNGLSLTVQVDETDVLLVRPGIAADVQLDAVPDGVYRARVTSVGVTPTTSSRGGVSYVVRLALLGGINANGDRAPTPLPGMSAVAELKVRNDRNVIAVPASAVFRDGGSDAVWLVTGGVANKRVVKLGAQGADTIGITSGLAVGDTIVITGADRVRAGQAIP